MKKILFILLVLVGMMSEAKAQEGYSVSLIEYGYDGIVKDFAITAVNPGEEKPVDILASIVSGECFVNPGSTVTLTIETEEGWFVHEVKAYTSIETDQMQSPRRSSDVSLLTQIPVTKGDGNTWTFTMPEANVQLYIKYLNTPPYFVDAENIKLVVPENTVRATAGTIKAKDDQGDAFAYEILGGTGEDMFDIGLTSGVVTMKAGVEPFDFEEWKDAGGVGYTLVIGVCDTRATRFDEVFCTSHTFTVNIADVNEEPYFTNETDVIYIAEGAAASTDVVTYADKDKYATGEFVNNELTIISDESNLFEISADGHIKSKEGVVLDYETQKDQVFTLKVRVRDANKDTDGNYIYLDLYEDKTFKVMVTDVNETPAFKAEAYKYELLATEHTEQVLGTVETTDPDIYTTDFSTITYSLEGDDAANFKIDATTGTISLKNGAQFNYATKSVYSFYAVASDNKNTVSVPVTVTLSRDTVTVTGGITVEKKTVEVKSTYTIDSSKAVIEGTNGTNNGLTISNIKAGSVSTDDKGVETVTLDYTDAELAGDHVANYVLAEKGHQATAPVEKCNVSETEMDVYGTETVTQTVTETVTDSNGVTTTTSNATKADAKGNVVSTTVTETVTQPNGSETVTETETDANNNVVRTYSSTKEIKTSGSLIIENSTSTEKNADGSTTVTDSRTEKDSKGGTTTTSTETKKDKDGNVVGTTETTETGTKDENGVTTTTSNATKKDGEGNVVSTTVTETVTKPNGDKTFNETETDTKKNVRTYSYKNVTDETTGTKTETVSTTKKNADGSTSKNEAKITRYADGSKSKKVSEKIMDTKGNASSTSTEESRNGDMTYVASKYDKDGNSESNTVREDAQGYVQTIQLTTAKKGKVKSQYNYKPDTTSAGYAPRRANTSHFFYQVDDAQVDDVRKVSNTNILISEESAPRDAIFSSITEGKKGESESKTTNSIIFGDNDGAGSQGIFAAAAPAGMVIMIEFTKSDGSKLICSNASVKRVDDTNAPTLRAPETNDDDDIEIVSGQKYEVLRDDGFMVFKFSNDDTPITITSISVVEPVDYDGGTVYKYMNTDKYLVNLNEGTGSANPLPDNAELAKLTYSRTLTTAGSGKGDITIETTPAKLYTVCLPFAPQTGTAVKYYTLSGVNGAVLTFSEVTTAPAANTPYLVAVFGNDNLTESCNNENVTSMDINSTTVDGYKFTGTFTGMSHTNAVGKYILQPNSKWGLVPNSGTVKIPPFRAYIEGPTNAPALINGTIGSETTGINTLQLVDADGTAYWYDLNGRRVSNPQKGIYIYKGRKVKK